jgi:NAD(P)-dependent dehydrogenase (short-subunit alcohol dehydrogenase family)
MATDLFDLSGKVALVTGASAGGLGYHSAVALAEHGADVFVADLENRAADLDQTVAAVQATGRRAAAGYCDVADEAQVDAMVTQALGVFGRIDILVHHPGVMLRKDAFDTTLPEWQRIVDINLTGTWLVNRRVAREMVRQGGGKIVNTSTLYTNIVGPLPESAYYASKAGVANLTRGLALEWGKQGINVNCLAPGVFYPTNMTAPLAKQPERLEWMRSRTLLGRLGNPEHDLKGVVVFLASPAADYVTGQVIFADGGWTAW